MEQDPKTPETDAKGPAFQEKTFCWKEMLDRAFTGWEPTDQALERIIDRLERQR